MFVVRRCHQRSNRFPAGLGLIALIVFLPPGSNPQGKMRKTGPVSSLRSLLSPLSTKRMSTEALLLPLANWEAENQSESVFTTTEPRQPGVQHKRWTIAVCVFFFCCIFHTRKSQHHHPSPPSQFMLCQTSVKLDAERNVSLKINYPLSLLGHLPRNSPSRRRTFTTSVSSCQRLLCAQKRCHISSANSTLKKMSASVWFLVAGKDGIYFDLWKPLFCQKPLIGWTGPLRKSFAARVKGPMSCKCLVYLRPYFTTRVSSSSCCGTK